MSGLASLALDHQIEQVVPGRAKLSALEGKANTYKGGEAQPIPPIPLFGQQDPDCNPTDDRQRPSKCFVHCDIGDLDDSSASSAYPPEDAGDPAKIDPPSWHKKSFCQTAVTTVLLTGVEAGGLSYGLWIQDLRGLNGNSGIDGEITKDVSGDPTKYHNVRCNFYPRYELPGLDFHGNAYGEEETDPVSGRRVATGPPVCEVIVRAKRLNVFPDKVEAVFFDGPDLAHVPSSDWNEAFGIYLALQEFQLSAVPQMCDGQKIVNGQLSPNPESTRLLRGFAHAYFR